MDAMKQFKQGISNLTGITFDDLRPEPLDKIHVPNVYRDSQGVVHLRADAIEDNELLIGGYKLENGIWIELPPF